MTLSEFLLARIAEDEERARAAAAATASGARYEAGTPVGETWQADRGMVVGAVDLWDDEGGADSLGMSFEAARHVASWDPARVLAECRARRGLIEAFQSLEVAIHQERDREKVGFLRAVRAGMESGLLTFALPYAGHPGYDPSWGV